MNQKTRLAIVAGIIIAIAGGATALAVTSPESQPTPPVDNSGGNSTEGGRQITVNLNESMSVEAK